MVMSSISQAEYDALLAKRPAKGWRQKARGLTNHVRGQMTKAEALYDQELTMLKAAGAVEWYAYEAVRLRIGAGAFYCPDFDVMYSSGYLEYVDVKGSGPIQEASLVRIKAAAQQFPFRFVIAQQQKNGGFERREI